MTRASTYTRHRLVRWLGARDDTGKRRGYANVTHTLDCKWANTIEDKRTAAGKSPMPVVEATAVRANVKRCSYCGGSR